MSKGGTHGVGGVALEQRCDMEFCSARRPYLGQRESRGMMREQGGTHGSGGVEDQ